MLAGRGQWRFMRLIHTNVEISAPAARVWDVLADFVRFPGVEPVHHANRGKG